MTEQIKEIISEVFGVDASDYADDFDLQEVGLDSMTSVEVVVSLEEAFGISVDDEDLLVENLCTIANLVALVE
ncbi:MAG: acyl carrier protein, partial [Pseudobutyrivibrio sp.]|nr:acyl carrier protein [Pseudobutyrivibrio sp.]